MAEQTRKPRPKDETAAPEAEAQKGAEKKTHEVDDLLDEIDEVLEEQSEEFVRQFVQKGGE